MKVRELEMKWQGLVYRGDGGVFVERVEIVWRREEGKRPRKGAAKLRQETPLDNC